MKKTLFRGDKKIAEFNLSEGRDVKVGKDAETGDIKIAIVKRKEATLLEK